MGLFVVATPIGNLSDMTFRAVDTLRKVDIIACEDTRQTLKLLNHFEIKKRLVSYHQHSKIGKIEELIHELEQGKEVALVTDAGTPGISDPGGILVEEARKKGIKVEVIPGPSAATAALSISGFDTKEFVFIGFLPQKKGRQTLLKAISRETKAVVIFESPFRIKKLLNELLEFVGDREVFVARELTKKFEETYKGKISEITPKISEKGEFVVILGKETNGK
jgi:16S rRNA (cytidine1402-2'-O)-methyltransferase